MSRHLQNERTADSTDTFLEVKLEDRIQELKGLVQTVDKDTLL